MGNRGSQSSGNCDTDSKAGEGGLEDITPSQTFSGVLYDGSDPPEGGVKIFSPDDLRQFTQRIVSRHPIYATGRKAVEGWRDNNDPLRTGEAKIDFDTCSMAAVVGQFKIDKVSARRGRGDALADVVVEYSVDYDKHHGREYTAVVVPLTAGITFKSKAGSGGQGGEGGGFVGQRVVDDGPMIAQRVVASPPMLDQRVVDDGPMIMQRAMDDGPEADE